jgi:hypothetical protein
MTVYSLCLTSQMRYRLAIIAMHCRNLKSGQLVIATVLAVLVILPLGAWAKPNNDLVQTSQPPMVTTNPLVLTPPPINEDQPDPSPLVLERKKSHLNHLYTFNKSPLGQRIPVILVPGRAEEYQRNAWWLMLQWATEADRDFVRRFKLYVYLYDSNDPLTKQSNGFIHDVKARFSHRLNNPSKQPLVLVTYSQGGLIAREAMSDSAIFNGVHTLFALGVPFHGSPIFERDWFSYYLGIRHFSPLRRVLDHAAYKVYLSDKSNLTLGMRWDNFDRSLARFDLANETSLGRTLYHQAKAHQFNQIMGQLDGNIASRLTNSLPSNTLVNQALHITALKKKTIIYASYLKNRFVDTEQRNGKALQAFPSAVGKSAKALPSLFFGSFFPIYVFSVHWVLQFTNDQLSNLPTYTPEAPFGKNTHLYAYNDGVVPLSSALYLPPSNKPYYGDPITLAQSLDVKQARIFSGLDHVELGEYTDKPKSIISADLLHPTDIKRSPNAWVLYDIKRLFD